MTDTPLDRLDPRSMPVADERIERLREDFPEVFREGKVDFDALRRSLGDWVEPGKERFGLTWPGKAACMQVIQAPSVGTLLPMRDESVDFDTTRNMIIEGDNLEVLKLLQKSYYGQVKMIYIDPPYNTGGEFIYPDRFQEGLHDYLRFSGQVDDEGFKISTNTETGGRYHTNWLNMMYPRLFLARNLLRDDGVIFVSIDDHEVHNLRALMDEVFGEENFIGCIEWNSTKSVTNTALISVSHTHNLTYAKNKPFYKERRHLFRLAESGEGFDNPDDDPRGPWKADPFQVGGERPNQLYEIVNPKTGQKYRPNPGCSWKNDYENFLRLVEDKRIVFGASGEAGPQRKRFKFEAEERGRVAKTLWDDVDTTANATKQLDVVMGGKVFDNPKPSNLIERFLQLGVYDHTDALVVDFFAGSGTTAEAVMRMNQTDRGKRRFILVQLPEPFDESKDTQKAAAELCRSLGKPPHIATITRERVRRAAAAMRPDPAAQADLLSGGADGEAPDLGFRAYKLATSNFKPWEGDVEKVAFVAEQLDAFADHMLDGRTADDVFTEILLKAGYDLTVPAEKLTLAGKEVWSVAGGDLLVCLDRELTLEVIEAMVERTPGQIVCLDAGFQNNDQLKVNAVQAIKSRARSEESTIVFKVV